MANVLGPGDVRVGHVVEGYENGGPVQAGTLTFDEKRGAELHIPYLWESERDPEPHQFTRANEWFKLDDERLPQGLLFVDEKGWVTLSGTHVSGQSFGSHPLGRVRAQAVIFNRPRTVKDDYLVKEFTSTIDGLEEFARFKPVSYDVERQASDLNRVTVVVDVDEAVEWETNGFAYSIRSNVAWSGQKGRNFHVVESEPFVQTVSSSGDTVRAHLAAQWPLRALLILVHGKKLAWRSHKLRDDEFPLWMMDGSELGPHSVEVQIAGTIEQHHLPRPDPNALVLPMLHLADIGADGMCKWVELYADENFRRAVQPAVEVINGATRFLEPQLMMLAISLDRFGYFRIGDSRRRAMNEHIEKCLEEAGQDWPQIGSRAGIAKAIANVNNDLKHPDRESYPDTDALAGIVWLAKAIVRAQVFDLLGANDRLRQKFLDYDDAQRAVRILTSCGITVDDNGVLVREPAPPGGAENDVARQT